ncbi:MAG: ABC transporter permease [Treponema sp.]|jgi:rhamnose transport system permease protein|nr:ABC transporter permease [Treponema sp.]
METRNIIVEKTWDAKKFFFQWEWMLVALLLIVHLINAAASPFYFSADTFLSVPMTFLDKAFIVFPMMLVLISGNGNIDISVGSTVALSSVIMGVSYNHGAPMPVAILLCILTATLCGFINGIILVKFHELPAMIVTLSTMILYRGIAYIILENRAAGKFPSWFNYFGWGYVGPLPFIFAMFIICAVIYGIVIHKTSFGRSVYSMGNNRRAALYSGINTSRLTLIIFTLAGFMSGFTALFLTSRMGSTRPNIASGYELDVIAMAVLGGVSTDGGKGRIFGPILAIFIIGYMQYGLGLLNQSAQVAMIVLGILLIGSVMINEFRVGNSRAKPVKK